MAGQGRYGALLCSTRTYNSLGGGQSHKECLGLSEAGGFLVVVDTPNRLSYCDYHTSNIPFFNNMNDEMVAIESWRSPRDSFRTAFHNMNMDEEKRNALIRWGRGVSYHAFESAIGWAVHERIVLTGFEKEVVDVWPILLEDTLMMTYFKAKPIHAHIAFARSALNFVLQKSLESASDNA